MCKSSSIIFSVSICVETHLHPINRVLVKRVQFISQNGKCQSMGKLAFVHITSTCYNNLKSVLKLRRPRQSNKTLGHYSFCTNSKNSRITIM